MTEQQFNVATSNRDATKACRRILQLVNDDKIILVLKATVNGGAIFDSLSVPDWMRKAIADAVQKQLGDLEAEFKEL